MPVVDPEYETNGFEGSGIKIPSGNEVGKMGCAVERSIQISDSAFLAGLSLISCRYDKSTPRLKLLFGLISIFDLMLYLL